MIKSKTQPILLKRIKKKINIVGQSLSQECDEILRGKVEHKINGKNHFNI